MGENANGHPGCPVRGSVAGAYLFCSGVRLILSVESAHVLGLRYVAAGNCAFIDFALQGLELRAPESSPGIRGYLALAA